MNWADIQALVGVVSAHGQVALLASMRQDEQDLLAALQQVRAALEKIDAQLGEPRSDY